VSPFYSRLTNSIILPFLALSLVVVSDLAIAQWTKTNGPEGTQSLSITSNGTLVAVGTYTGAYMSSNAGASWYSIATGIEGYQITSLLFRGNDLYAGTMMHGLLVRRNGSSAWEDHTGTLTRAYSTSFSSLTLHGTSLFACLGNALYQTTDDGATWTQSDSGMTGKIISQVISGNGILMAATGWDGVYRSTDGGKFWAPVNNGLSSVYVFQVGSAGSLFITTSGSGFFLSTDNGSSWNPANATYSYPNFYSIASHASTILVTTFGAVYRSTDGGPTWTGITTGIPFDGSGNAVSCGSVFIMATSKGMYRSTDDGLSWSPSSTGMAEPYVQDLVTIGSSIAAGTISGFYLSTDEGNQWLDRSPDQSASTVIGLAIDDQNTLYATSNTALNTYSSFRSTDNGLSWSPIASGIPLFGYPFGFAWANGSLYSPTTAGLSISTDGGTSWSPAPAPLATIAVRDLSASGTTLAAATSRGAYVSTDGGTTWEQRNTGLSDTSHASSIMIHGSTIVMCNYNYGVFRSTNLGVSWAKIPNMHSINKFLTTQNDYFAAGSYGVYQSSDDGQTWKSVGTGLHDSSGSAITSLGHSDGSLTLFLATSRNGVWKRPGGELITGVQVSDAPGMPRQFRLEQNYPNPFNPATLISYAIPESRENGVGSMETKLVVYDLLGREVATLVNERKEAGTYSVRFDASGLASGMYLYRLTSGKFTECRKMLLMK
jgi:photosystem II stability/assembly factor-like uncharacterized protein